MIDDFTQLVLIEKNIYSGVNSLHTLYCIFFNTDLIPYIETTYSPSDSNSTIRSYYTPALTKSLTLRIISILLNTRAPTFTSLRSGPGNPTTLFVFLRNTSRAASRGDNARSAARSKR